MARNFSAADIFHSLPLFLRACHTPLFPPRPSALLPARLSMFYIDVFFFPPRRPDIRSRRLGRPFSSVSSGAAINQRPPPPP